MRSAFCSLAVLAVIFPLVAVADDLNVQHVEAAGARFPFVQEGEGDPILFVHGDFADLRAWEPIREGVAKSHRFVAYTQRWHGTVEWPTDPTFSRDVHDADLVALLGAWNQPMHLVGFSYSGAIVLRAAMERPDLVRSVVIFEPSFETVIAEKPEHQQTITDWSEGWAPSAAALERGRYDQALRSAIEYMFGLPEGGFETLSESVRFTFLDNAHTVAKQFRAPFPNRLTCDDLSGVQAPALIVWGTETLPFFEAVSREVAACIPDAELAEIPDAGHGGPLQASEAFLEKTVAFVDALGGSASRAR